MSDSAVDEGDLQGALVVALDPMPERVERMRGHVLAASEALREAWRTMADPSPAAREAACEIIVQASRDSLDVVAFLRRGREGDTWRTVR